MIIISFFKSSQARKEKILEIDRNRTNKFTLSDIDRENMDKNNILLSYAQQKMDEEDDSVKEMNKMVLYSKVATIRDKQRDEQKQIY